ncbi:MAG: hypothetical protein WC934_02885 [Acidithiobacillus sp.]|jgi:hypothetical protein|uniref:hypothetical protein n=1 Tax=Acidithiobacillus sp. TaxID=1872118 RepID=UPI00355F3E14
MDIIEINEMKRQISVMVDEICFKDALKLKEIINILNDMKKNKKGEVTLDSVKNQLEKSITQKIEQRKEKIEQGKCLINWNIHDVKFGDGTQWIRFNATDGITESTVEKVILNKELTKIGFAFEYNASMVQFFNGKDKKGRNTDNRMGYWNNPYWMCGVEKISYIQEHEYFNTVKYTQLFDYINDILKIKGIEKAKIQSDSVKNILI